MVIPRTITLDLIIGNPTLLLPSFGYAGRTLLYNYGKKAEQTAEQTKIPKQLLQ